MTQEEKYKIPMTIYQDRLALRDVPVGAVDTKSNQWLPSIEHGEYQQCCHDIYGTESQGWYMFKHCLSPHHIGSKCGLTGKDLQEFVAYASCTQFDACLAKGDDIDDNEKIKK